MLSMSVEEVKALVSSHDTSVLSAGLAGNPSSGISPISATVMQESKNKFVIIFDTPIGLIKVKSSRREVRTFASVDSAMSAIKQCGRYAATVICRGE